MASTTEIENNSPSLQALSEARARISEATPQAPTESTSEPETTEINYKSLTALRVIRHGGWCCGAYHIVGFTSLKKFVSHDLDLILSANEQFGDSHNRMKIMCDPGYKYGQHDRPDYHGNFMLECILTDDQLREYETGPVLKEKGFKLTCRWKNPNSGKYCNQFTWVDGTGDCGELPFSF